MNQKEQDAFRMTKAREFLADCKTAEDTARVELARAIELTKLARQKHEALFLETEARAVARREAVAGY